MHPEGFEPSCPSPGPGFSDRAVNQLQHGCVFVLVRASGGSRTHTYDALNAVPLPVGLRKLDLLVVVVLALPGRDVRRAARPEVSLPAGGPGTVTW